VSENVELRKVVVGDLPTFFEHQQDDVANRMAAFTVADPTDRGAFDARWQRLLSADGVTKRTVLVDGRVAGSIMTWVDEGVTEVTYGLGREYWGRGIATRALREMLGIVTVRPIRARVAKDNVGSMRVLEKCGFTVVGEDAGFAHARGCETEEWILSLDDGAPSG